MSLFFLLAIGAIVAGSLIFGMASRRRREDELRTYARELGLTFSPASWPADPQLHGTIDGHHVVVDTFTTGSSKNRKTWTRVRVDVGVPLPPGLEVHREGLGATFSKLLGAQDLQIGDPIADAALLIQAQAEQDALAFLRRPEVHESLLVIEGPNDGLQRDDVKLCARGQGRAVIEPLLHKALMTARTLHHCRQPDWDAVRALPGLDEARLDPGGRSLIVRRGTATVHVTDDPAAGTTTLRAPLASGLPTGLRVRRGTSELGHPILDRMIRAEGASPEVLLDLLGHDEVIEDLLTVVHGQHGIVTDTAVVVRLAASGPPDLAERVEDVLRLAEALGRRHSGT